MAAPPKDEWYYHKDDVTHGPLSFKGLRQLVAAGMLGPEDSVWSAERDRWVPAAALPKLFVKKKPVARPASKEDQPTPPASSWPAWVNRFLWSMVPVLCVVAWYAGREVGYKEGQRVGYERGTAEGQAQGSSAGFQQGFECASRGRSPQDGKGVLPVSLHGTKEK